MSSIPCNLHRLRGWRPLKRHIKTIYDCMAAGQTRLGLRPWLYACSACVTQRRCSCSMRLVALYQCLCLLSLATQTIKTRIAAYLRPQSTRVFRVPMVCFTLAIVSSRLAIWSRTSASSVFSSRMVCSRRTTSLNLELNCSWFADKLCSSRTSFSFCRAIW